MSQPDPVVTTFVSVWDGRVWTLVNRCDSEMVQDDDGTQRWLNETGQLHRRWGPAVSLSNGDRQWWINGVRHRSHGHPAVIRADGTTQWWTEGVRQPDPKPFEVEARPQPQKMDLKLQPGMVVVFTGAPVDRDGVSTPRSEVSKAAQDHGLEVGASLTKSGTDLLAAGDPDTTSNKATKARRWGIPIVRATDLLKLDETMTIEARGEPGSGRVAT